VAKLRMFNLQIPKRISREIFISHSLRAMWKFNLFSTLFLLKNLKNDENFTHSSTPSSEKSETFRQKTEKGIPIFQLVCTVNGTWNAGILN
jgi:hypothetical protein